MNEKGSIETFYFSKFNLLRLSGHFFELMLPIVANKVVKDWRNKYSPHICEPLVLLVVIEFGLLVDLHR